jgi:hypothetical protein
MQWLLPAAALLLICRVALAHPEDEFCTADSGLDPALCAALAESDRAADLDSARGPGAMLTEAQREQVQHSLLLGGPGGRRRAVRPAGLRTYPAQGPGPHLVRAGPVPRLDPAQAAADQVSVFRERTPLTWAWRLPACCAARAQSSRP